MWCFCPSANHHDRMEWQGTILKAEMANHHQTRELLEPCCLSSQSAQLMEMSALFRNNPASGILLYRTKELRQHRIAGSHIGCCVLGDSQHTTYSFMCFILVLAMALLKTDGLGDMSAAALVTVLVSEIQMHSPH